MPFDLPVDSSAVHLYDELSFSGEDVCEDEHTADIASCHLMLQDIATSTHHRTPTIKPQDLIRHSLYLSLIYSQ
jgi:hypothetical protein